MGKVYQYFSTVCVACQKVVGLRWSWERWSMYPSQDDEYGSEGIGPSDNKPCPYCKGSAKVGISGRRRIGTNLSKVLLFSLCKGCDAVIGVKDRKTSEALHEAIRTENGYCEQCRLDRFLVSNPDPSNADEKYK